MTTVDTVSPSSHSRAVSLLTSSCMARGSPQTAVLPSVEKDKARRSCRCLPRETSRQPRGGFAIQAGESWWKAAVRWPDRDVRESPARGGACTTSGSLRGWKTAGLSQSLCTGRRQGQGDPACNPPEAPARSECRCPRSQPWGTPALGEASPGGHQPWGTPHTLRAAGRGDHALLSFQGPRERVQWPASSRDVAGRNLPEIPFLSHHSHQLSLGSQHFWSYTGFGI